MRRVANILMVPGLLLSILLAGCGTKSDEGAGTTKVLEHTSSQPPPGVLEKQQQQSKMQADAGHQQKPK